MTTGAPPRSDDETVVVPPPAPGGSSLVTALLVLAVGMAFADSSVVVLALPDLYGEFDTSIVAVSWVITAYNVVLATAGFGLVPMARRLPTRGLAAVGLAVFAAASAVCGAASSFAMLVTARCVQGLGAALLLTAALTVLGARTGSRRRGIVLWGLAATVGAALGPALGGVLTELLSWRSIFLVQAPLAAVALAAVARPRTEPPAEAATAVAAARAGTRRLVANLGFVTVFGALVGALFLSVLLVVVAWRYSPIAGALLVSALPLGTLVAGWLEGRLGGWVAAAGGAALLAAGLVALAFLPGESPAVAGGALAACGLGLGVVAGLLGPASLADAASPTTAAAATVGARHLGFVLGLVLIAPVFAGNLERATADAEKAAAATVLDADIPIQQKLSLTGDLRDVMEATPRGRVPDLDAAFADHDGERMAVVRHDLGDAIGDIVTRAFRSSFLLAAALGALAAVPALVVVSLGGATSSAAAPATARRRVGWPEAALVAGLAVAVGLVGVELASGATTLGDRAEVSPCDSPDDPFPQGKGIDGVLQRITLSGLDGAACELGTGREVLVLSLSANSRFADEVHWDQDQLERALKAGFVRAVDDADARGTLPGWAASLIKPMLDRLPLDWLLGKVDLGGLGGLGG